MPSSSKRSMRRPRKKLGSRSKTIEAGTESRWPRVLDVN
jgi:hypothetical protein